MVVTGSACFNCGEHDHIVSACPQPINRQLVALSRDMFTFVKAERGSVDYKRIHEVEEWRQQRLEFLDIFEPGEIRGAILRDALCGRDGDWLENMSIWGYPKGWVNVDDPREKVKQMIWDENCDGEDTFGDFLIFGNDGVAERVRTHGRGQSLYAEHSTEMDDDDDNHFDDSSLISTLSSASTPTHPIRWATYPPSLFSSQLLPVYNGFALPPISHQGSSTYTTHRHALWQQIRAGSSNAPPPPCSKPPPIPPPPPDTEPPPIPPPPPLDTEYPQILPPLPLDQLPSLPGVLSSQSRAAYKTTSTPDDDEEMDMDMSDSE
ncbi:hypothetical protein H0H87_003190 [Tephrocybe sp. NHM501043]|nr:hypothetical protein H0H87_003190 [Tephrocybe sp. NHM501043]